MTADLPPIYFYIPEQDWPAEMPERADIYWQGFGRGIYCWTLQTYLHLQASGFPCEFVGTVPESGIMLAHRDSLPTSLQPGPKLLLVCLQAERERHPYAQLHVVQNPRALVQTRLPRDRYYIPLWPQPGLIPRDPARGNQFINVAYFGLERNLAPELQDPAWQDQVKALGLSWQVINRDRWHNYSDVDVVVAVRSFDRENYTSKPATKLFNAWHAGVPAIMGYDSAFRAERRSELDYLEVTSADELLVALQKLRDNPELRQTMMDQGRIRAQETASAKLVTRWCNFLTDVAVPVYEQWCDTPYWSRYSTLMSHYLVFKLNRVQNRVRSLIPSL